MRFILLTFLAAVPLLSPGLARADFFEKLGFGKKTNALPALSTSALSQDQIVSGLKEALAKGVQQAITQLGRTNGFMTNVNVKIPLPEKLQTVEKTLRAMKQEKLADDFVATMNRAAEQAVPAAGSVFADAVKKMSIDDARGLLTGGEDSATQFFRRATEMNLFARFLPIVTNATAQTGVVSAYKKLMQKTGTMLSTSTNSTLSGLANLGRNFGADKYLTPEVTDIDSYVTQKALDGLFKTVAVEEKKIRENPAARTTELLQKVFGAVKK